MGSSHHSGEGALSEPDLSASRSTDEAAGFDIRDSFERFNQRDDVFRRSWWDPGIRNDKSRLFYETYREPLSTWRTADGFTQKLGIGADDHEDVVEVVCDSSGQLPHGFHALSREECTLQPPLWAHVQCGDDDM